MNPHVQRIRDLLFIDLWREVPTASRLKAGLLHIARISILAGRSFVADKCVMRATALAFATLLSLVPLLAFAFSVLKGFGGVQERLKPVVHTIVGGQEDVVTKVLDYVKETNVGALGTIGLLFVVWTTVRVLGTIEKSFNDIWGVKQSRTLLRKVADYISVLVISPILLLAAMSLTGMLQHPAVASNLLLGFASRFLIRLAPFLGTWIAFAAAYVFMPNTKVRLSAAVVGGILAGTAWQFAFWAYTTFQIGVASKNAIYGTFAALPVFMIWLHLSWAIVLFGAEASWAVQNVGRYWEEQRSEGASYATREEVAVRAMTALAVAFFRDGRPLRLEEIAARLKAPSRLVGDVLGVLAEAGLCAEVLRGHATAWQPGRALERITPADAIAALRSHGGSLALQAEGPEAALVADLLHPPDAPPSSPAGVTFRDLAARLAEAEPPSPDDRRGTAHD